jgi:rod shape-determining protein MreC
MLSRRRTLTLLVVLCLGHILLISAQVQARDGRSVLRGSAFGVMAGLQRATAAVAGSVSGVWSGYFALVGVSRENDALRNEVLELQGQLQEERARGARTTALEDALNLQRSLVAPTLAARVIAGNPLPGERTITIDRGTADGVAPNMAVIAGPGIVGRIIGEPTARASIVQLVVGQRAAAGALIERTEAAGVVTGGFADGHLRMDLLSSAAVLQAGDRVVTSGQDGIYPRGFLIGTIHEVRGAGKGREIVVAPAVDFSFIDVVLVVLRVPQGAGDAP